MPAMSADFDPGTGLGPRLRLAREERGLSARELARRVGCSASLISQIERGVSVPSVGVLYSLATELDSSLDYLLFGSDQAQRAELRRAAADPAAASKAGRGTLGGGPAARDGEAAERDGEAAGRDGEAAERSGEAAERGGEAAERAGLPGIVQRAGCRKIIDLASGVRWERLTPGSDERTDFLEVIYSPGGHSTDERRPLRHDGREYGLIISGTLQANVGFESYELGPGDSIAFDSSTPHEYLNKTGDSVHAIWVVVHAEPGRA
ncbi:MAG TPA: helix-turn-helix domain-containing protein [Streptosporangiaceae bacterium]|nr:helix-turn-helix domain-containing protein [Streptosporangiaceae bacterium]